MTKETKKFIIPGTALLVSLYLSFLFALGIILGYILTNFIYKKYNIDTNKGKWILFNIGEWEVHIHHWVYGVLIILAIVWFESLSMLPNIFIGALGGLIFHDLYIDKNWYKIIYKK